MLGLGKIQISTSTSIKFIFYLLTETSNSTNMKLVSPIDILLLTYI